MPPPTVPIDVEEFTQALSLLVRRIRAAGSMHRLSLPEAAALARLDKDGPCTTAELARAEGVKPQSMGAIVEALQQAGMVERKPHPTDGRQRILQLTPGGVATRGAIRAAKRTWLAEAIAQLPKPDQATLKRLVEL